MSMRDDFLEEIHEGDFITVSYGENPVVTVMGEVIKLTDSQVRIQTDEGSPRIRLESIVSYDDAPANMQQKTPVPKPAAVPVSTPAYPEGMQTLISCMQDALPLGLDDIANRDGIKARFAEADYPQSVKNGVLGLESTFGNILKNMPMSENLLKDNMHNVTARALRISVESPEAAEDIYALLGAMNIQIRDFSAAHSYFEKAGDTLGAVYACDCGGISEEFDRCIDRYVRRPDIADAYLYRIYARSARMRKNAIALCERFNELRAISVLEEEDVEELECLCACALDIARKENLPLQWAMGYSRAMAVKCLEQFISSLPSSWEKVSAESGAPQNNAGNSKRHVSAIKVFMPGLNGFIHGPTNERDYFFYIDNVNKDDDLRKLLACGGMERDLEVSFLLGKSRNATETRPCAYDIRLTERGAAEAARRLARHEVKQEISHEIKSGELVEFNSFNGFGRIHVGDESYGVILREIVDPYLRVYLLSNFTYEDVPVEFNASKDKNGKDIALKVRLAGESIMPSDFEVRDMIRQGLVKQEDFDGWQEKKESLLLPEEPKPVEISDYYLRPYVALEPYEEAKPEPAPEPVKPAVPQKVEVQSESYAVSGAKLPPREVIPVNPNNPFKDMDVEFTPGMSYYDEAHKNMINKDLAAAELGLKRALRAGDRIESSIADLVTVFLNKNNERMQDALDLMEVYGEHLPEQRRINLLIQIYQKYYRDSNKENGENREERDRHYRPYKIELCHLYEQALAQRIAVSTKLHMLNGQGDVLLNLGEYDMALNSYRRWRQIYNSEVQYRGQSAVTELASRLNNIKRGEAQCYYFKGDNQRAVELANELMRVSSADDVAKNIIAGTLKATAAFTTSKAGDPNDFGITSDEEINLGNAKLSGFASARVNDISLSKYMKSYALKNDEYTGSARQAQDDINFILNTQGKTPSTRSALLLCAAKIVLSVQERLGKDNAQDELRRFHLTEGDVKKYVARSMASYGDSILIEQQEQDTARYAYLQAIEMLISDETDWKKSVFHYVSSYFRGQQDVAQIVRENNSGARVRDVDISIIAKEKPHDIGEFIVGMLELRRVFRETGNDMRFQLVERMRRCAAIDEIDEWFTRNGIDMDCSSSDKFAGTLKAADERMRDVVQELKELIELLPSQILSRINSEEMLRQLRGEQYKNWLGYADKKRLEQICRILSDFRGYFGSPEFANRTGTLNAAITQIVKLMDEIEKSPTKLSYDIFYPALDTARLQLQERIEKLYSDLPPDIEVSLNEDAPPYLGGNNEVYVHLTVRNGSYHSRGDERQLADNVELKVGTKTAGVSYVRMDTEMSDFINGGKELETILVFRITDEKVLTLGSFDLEVECTYRYNERPAETRESAVTFNEAIAFKKAQHVEIENPFSNYTGNEVGEESMFYGRDELIEKLIGTLKVNGRFNYGRGVLFYGQTRAGKSSIRVHFVRKVRAKYPDIILVDMGNLNGGDMDEAFFYNAILSKLEVELAENHPDTAALIREKEIESPCDRIIEHPDRAAALFSRYMDRVYKLLLDQNKMILLVADEFSAINTAIKDGRLPKSFMQAWKALLENYGIFAVAFGQDDTPMFARMNQNAFARMAQEKVTYLEEEPAKRLMYEPIQIRQSDGSFKSRYTDAALDELYELTSGSAFLIMKLCDMLVNYLNRKGADNVTTGILRNFLKNDVLSGGLEERDFEPQICDRADETLAPLNRRILLNIARESQINGWAEIDMLDPSEISPAEGQSPRQRLDELLLRLHERDVVDMEAGRRCRIKVRLLSEWLLARYGKE